MLKRAEDAPTPLKVGAGRSWHHACHVVWQSASCPHSPPPLHGTAVMATSKHDTWLRWYGISRATWALCLPSCRYRCVQGPKQAYFLLHVCLLCASYLPPPNVQDETVGAIAQQLGKTPAQVGRRDGGAGRAEEGARGVCRRRVLCPCPMPC